MARKLKECGVFGVSSDEYLTYALKNRDEWESRGQSLVEEMREKVAAGRLGQQGQPLRKLMKAAMNRSTRVMGPE